MQLGALDRARRECEIRISWTVLFGRAYALVGEQMPELRDLFVRWPTRQLYRHPFSVASLSIHRKDDEGNERLIWGRWDNSEQSTLSDMQTQLDHFCTAPMAEAYREGLMLERTVTWVRRLAWWWVMQCAGRKRAKHVGTFSISSLGGQGVLNAHHPLITTSSLAFGPILQTGECEVVLLCDHRTLDGVLGAAALKALESVLVDQMPAEMNKVRIGMITDGKPND